jgi:hypothetical protein
MAKVWPLNQRSRGLNSLIRQPTQAQTFIMQFFARQSYGNMCVMARKKKVKRFRAVQAVKELARERVGTPPAEKIVPQKRRKPERHRLTIKKLLNENEED